MILINKNKRDTFLVLVKLVGCVPSV